MAVSYSPAVLLLDTRLQKNSAGKALVQRFLATPVTAALEYHHAYRLNAILLIAKAHQMTRI